MDLMKNAISHVAVVWLYILNTPDLGTLVLACLAG